MKYADDYHVGSIHSLGSYLVTAEEIIDFASRFDPQPYHLSQEAGNRSFFGGLVASGWHTTAIWMGLYVRALLVDAHVEGSPGVDLLRWHAPVRPEDRLIGSVEILELASSPFRKDLVTIKKKGLLTREEDQKPLLSLVLHSRFLRRPS